MVVRLTLGQSPARMDWSSSEMTGALTRMPDSSCRRAADSLRGGGVGRGHEGHSQHLDGGETPLPPRTHL